MKEKLKIIWKKSIPYFLITLVALISMSIFIDKGYIQGHDLYYHAASSEGMAGGSIADIFTVKIYDVISNNLGYGEGLFYPPLSHIGAALVYKLVSFLGIGGIYLAMRISYFFIIFFAGVFMRKLVLLITKNRNAALAATIFYMTFPYFLVNIIVRCAMAEAMIFVFMPIVLIGIYHLTHNSYRRFLIYFTLGCIGIVHSHLIMTLFFVGLAIIGFLPNIKEFFKKKRILYLIASIIITTLISLPFLLPMMENKLNTDYRVFQENFMTHAAGVDMWRVPIGQYFSMNGKILTVPVIISVTGLIATIYVIFCYKDIRTQKNRMFLSFSLIVTIIGFLCTTTLFPWRILPRTLLLIQFPERLLTIVALGLAIIMGLVVAKFKDTKIDIMIIVLVAMSSLFGIMRVNSFAYENLPVAASEEDLNHTSSIIIDYLPTVNPVTHEEKNYDFINDYPSQAILTDQNDVTISDIVNHVPDISFRASGIKDRVILTLPRIYYLGYSIKAEYSDETSENLPYSMSKYGFIEVALDKDAKITVTYPGTPMQRVAYLIAGATILGFTIYCIVSYRKRN